jgi:ribonuclease HI
MKYIVYTDGAYSQMNDEGAYAFVILTELNNEVKRFAEKITHETNNRAELKAIIAALHQLPQDAKKVLVESDSQYALMTLFGSWSRKKNEDLFDVYENIISKRRFVIEWSWVKGHSGDTFNEMCDEMCNQVLGYNANEEYEKYKRIKEKKDKNSGSVLLY